MPEVLQCITSIWKQLQAEFPQSFPDIIWCNAPCTLWARRLPQFGFALRGEKRFLCDHRYEALGFGFLSLLWNTSCIDLGVKQPSGRICLSSWSHWANKVRTNQKVDTGDLYGQHFKTPTRVSFPRCGADVFRLGLLLRELKASLQLWSQRSAG